MVSITRLSILIIVIAIGCSKPDKIVERSINEPVESASSLKILALEIGDTLAYEKLSTLYMDSPYDGFFFVALIMANKYDYNVAQRDVFYCLTDFYDKNPNTDYLLGLDSITSNMALQYLLTAAKW